MTSGGGYDVVVVGSGNAALTAAISAREAGARVLVLEKAPYEERAGNTRFTGGIVRFAHSGLDDIVPLVPELSQSDTSRLDVTPYPPDAFYDDLLRLSEGCSDPELTSLLVDRSYETVRWMQGIGVRFEMYATSIKHGGRTSFPAGAVVQFWGGGQALTQSLLRAARGRGVDVAYDAPVLEVLRDVRGAVHGVRVGMGDDATPIPAGAVVLACGGFGASPSLRARYLGREWEQVKVRGTRHNTGELLEQVREFGARATGDWTGCHAVPVDAESPDVGDLDLGDLTARLSYPFSVMVNAEDRRFTDEGSDFKSYSYARLGREILVQPRGVAYQLFDQQTVGLLEPRYSSARSTATAATLEELATRLGLPREQMVRTVEEFNRAVQGGVFNPSLKDGKGTAGIDPPKTNWALRLEKPPFVAYGVRCGITFTYGGLLVNERAQVVGESGDAMPRLYAAGEATGGIFYHNYPSGSGLMLGAVFGRIAGSSAAAEALSVPG